MKSHSTSFFVVLKPTFGVYDKESVSSVKAVKISQNRPNTLAKGEIAVKLTVDVPEKAFSPFQPEAVVKIPESVLQKNSQVSVYACDDCASYAQMGVDELYEHSVLAHGVEPEGKS